MNEIQKYNLNVPKKIEKTLDERGFYLYEWITQEELKQAISYQYFSIMQKFAMIMVIFSFIGGVIGYIGGGILGSFLAIIAVSVIFNFGVFLIFLVKIFYTGKLYSKFANVVLTDSHMTVGNNIFSIVDKHLYQKILLPVENTFNEKLFSHSELSDKLQNKKNIFFEEIKNIFNKGLDLYQSITKNISHSKNSGQIIGALTVIGFFVFIIFVIILTLSYFVGLPVVYFMSLIAVKIYHKILLLTQKTEYKINHLFSKIKTNSDNLEIQIKKNINLLSDITNGNIFDNLFGKINNSFHEINLLSLNATNSSIELKKILENSNYKDIFNFGKYDIWLKNQIVIPMKKLLTVMDDNKKILQNSIENISNQIQITEKIEHKKTLELQKLRLKQQILNFEKVEKTLEGNINKIS